MKLSELHIQSKNWKADINEYLKSIRHEITNPSSLNVSSSPAHVSSQVCFTEYQSRMIPICETISKHLIVIVLDYAQKQKSGSKGSQNTSPLKPAPPKDVQMLHDSCKNLHGILKAVPVSVGRSLIIDVGNDIRSLLTQICVLLECMQPSLVEKPTKSGLTIIQHAGLVRKTCEQIPTKSRVNSHLIKAHFEKYQETLPLLMETLNELSMEKSEKERPPWIDDDFDQSDSEHDGEFEQHDDADNLDDDCESEIDESLEKSRKEAIDGITNYLDRYQSLMPDILTVMGRLVSLPAGQISPKFNAELDAFMYENEELIQELESYVDADPFDLPYKEHMILDDFQHRREPLMMRLNKIDGHLADLKKFVDVNFVSTSLTTYMDKLRLTPDQILQ